jgi:hypothetical protein
MYTDKGSFDIDDEWYDSSSDWYVRTQPSIQRLLTTEEILDSINIIDIERYLRKKKLEKINEVRKTLNK